MAKNNLFMLVLAAFTLLSLSMAKPADNGIAPDPIIIRPMPAPCTSFWTVYPSPDPRQIGIASPENETSYTSSLDYISNASFNPAAVSIYTGLWNATNENRIAQVHIYPGSSSIYTAPNGDVIAIDVCKTEYYGSNATNNTAYMNFNLVRRGFSIFGRFYGPPFNNNEIIYPGDNVTLNWQTFPGATRCTASSSPANDEWNQPASIAGLRTVHLQETTTFTVSCYRLRNDGTNRVDTSSYRTMQSTITVTPRDPSPLPITPDSVAKKQKTVAVSYSEAAPVKVSKPEAPKALPAVAVVAATAEAVSAQ